MDWRSGKLQGPRDPPFQRPEPSHDMHDEEDPEEEEPGYTHIPPARRPTTSNAAHSDGRYSNSHVSSQSPFADPPYRNSGYSNSAYTPSSVQQPLAAGRPSMDAYGAFSDPPPSGYGAPTRRESAGPPTIPEVDMGGPIVSRTMQYADPYAAVRASIHQGPASPTGVPPSYESYQGYR